MKNVLRKYGLLGGTAAACVACCTAPLFMGPLLAWLGASTLGLVGLPWYLLLLTIPALLMLARKMGKHNAQAAAATGGDCGCSSPSSTDERKTNGCQ